MTPLQTEQLQDFNGIYTTMSMTKTTVFFNGGPWDGDQCESTEPLDVVKVEGEDCFIYQLITPNQYQWIQQHFVSPKSKFFVPLSGPESSSEKPKRFKWGRLLLGIAMVITAGVFACWLLVNLSQEANRGNELLLQKSTRAIQAKTAALPATPTPVPLWGMAKAADDLLKNPKPISENDFNVTREGLVLQIEHGDLGADILSVLRRWDAAKGMLVPPVTIVNPTPTPAPTPGTPTWTLEEALEKDRQAARKRAETITIVEPDPTPTPAPRAQLARPQIVATMPYGERVAIHFRGTLPNQEALPRLENDLGDTYQIGKDYFVWVTPNGGPAQWVDPTDFGD